MWKTPLGRFRAVALLEGLSFVVLLFIAMPLKYLAGMPLAVKVVGMAHGVLFLLYIPSLIEVAVVHRWSLLRGVVAFAASLVPFGTFVLEATLRREARAAGQPSPSMPPGTSG
jgi:integral membrane protein